mmetsp:Transcript_22533/g.76182  ORF Transcript_22533/g.76182 Transcript_22533/m.76182 type:complete len:397 (-) Transcript_22533:443-1633(-)
MASRSWPMTLRRVCCSASAGRGSSASALDLRRRSLDLSFENLSCDSDALVEPSDLQGCRVPSELFLRTRFSPSSGATFEGLFCLARSEARLSRRAFCSSSCSKGATFANFGLSTFRTFSRTVFLIARARCAYLRVFNVSSNEDAAGDACASIKVRVLPPSESFNKRVSLESRKFTYAAAPLPGPLSPCARRKPLITLPSASSDRLMRAPSANRAPEFCVSAARSLPAKSIMHSLARRRTRSPRWASACCCDALLRRIGGKTSVASTLICRMACDLDDSACAPVDSCVRLELPWCSSSMTASTFATCTSVTPQMVGPSLGSSRSSRPPQPPWSALARMGPSPSKSRISSLYSSTNDTINLVFVSEEIANNCSSVSRITPVSPRWPSIVCVLPDPVCP